MDLSQHQPALSRNPWDGPRRAAITGVGLVTPLGLTVHETWISLLEGRHLRTTGRVPIISPTGVARVTDLARIAAYSAVKNHYAENCSSENCSTDGPFGPSTALVVGTSKGPIEEWLKDVHPPFGNSWGLAQISSVLAREFHIGGAILTVSSACASGLHALIRGAMLICSGEADRALVVAAESSLHPLFLACYQRLGVLTPEANGCRPFDRFRSGFFVSEAAAAVLIEAREVDAPRRVGDIAILDRFAMGGDATHITGSDPASRTLKRLINHVANGQTVDLIHAHGTGTESNDALELAALDSLFSGIHSETLPSVYSHKGAIGHALGASGLIAIVLNCLAHQHQIVPPNVQTTHPMEMGCLLLNAQAVNRPIRRSLAIAAGFGGATAIVSLVNA